MFNPQNQILKKSNKNPLNNLTATHFGSFGRPSKPIQEKTITAAKTTKIPIKKPSENVVP